MDALDGLVDEDGTGTVRSRLYHAILHVVVPQLLCRVKWLTIAQHMRGHFEAIPASTTSFVGLSFSSPSAVEREITEAGIMDEAPVAEANKLASVEEMVRDPFPPHYLETLALVWPRWRIMSRGMTSPGALTPTRIIEVWSPSECHRNPRVDAVRTPAQNVAWAPDRGRTCSPAR